ncbi:MAG: hypothetical protein IKL32_03405 [Alphaproteobacteria bacterium]|nr:hypothetical protein [Alphaproteobacteria bacterium]
MKNFKNNEYKKKQYQMDSRFRGNDSEKELSSSGLTRGSIKHHIGFITVICLTLMISNITFADDTTTEICADGAGIVMIGKLNQKKYCYNPNIQTFWNAYAWCDAQGARLLDLTKDCECTGTTNCYRHCPNLANMTDENVHAYTLHPYSSTSVYTVYLQTPYNGEIRHFNFGEWNWGRALCVWD